MLSNRENTISSSNHSFDSIPEMKKNRLCLKVYFYTFLILIAINGIVILIKHKELFPPEISFQSQLILRIFIYIYSLGVLSALLLTVIVSSIVFVVLISIKKCTKKNKGNSLKDHEELPNEGELYAYELEDKINFLAYFFTIFIVMIIIVYLTGVPLSLYLLYSLLNEKVMQNFKRFYLIYTFLSLNSIVGISLSSVGFFRCIGKKIKVSVRKSDFHIESNHNNASSFEKDMNKIISMPIIKAENTINDKQDQSA